MELLVYFTLVALVLGFLVPIFAERYAKRDRLFDERKWKDGPFYNYEEEHYPRLTMVSDLRRNHLHPGMPKSDVIALLGKSDAGPAPSPGGLSYALGAEPAYKFDYDHLDLHFDSSGRLVRTEISQW